MTPTLKYSLASALLASLAACGTTNSDLKESLGITHHAPDEYRVYSRPPLTVPPEFELHPPGTGSQGSEYTAGVPADVQAHNAVLGTQPEASAPSGLPSLTPAPPPGGKGPDVQTSEAPAAAVTSVSTGELPSSADSQFLSNAGATQADPLVKQKIDDDNGTAAAKKDSHYLFTGDKGADPTVDANKEAARLKQDQQQNKPPTTGDTPVVEPKDKGILGDIF